MSRIHDALKKAEQDQAEGAIPEAIPTATLAESAATPASPVLTAAPSATELRKLVQDHSRLCAWKPDPRLMLFSDGKNFGMGTEEFRTLRSNLYLIRDRQPLQKLLITSPLRLEGKTFTAANLAQVIARQQEQRVLLIDADLRLSSMHRFLAAPSTPGLADYLSDAADEFSIIQRGPLENLYFIPGGSSSPTASELIGNGRLRLLLSRLAPVFDWVIFDSPPCVPISDAKLLADVCDGVLVVIHAGETPAELAQKACQEFHEKQLLGVVLNRVKADHTYSCYYHHKKSVPKKKQAVLETGNP